LARAVLGRAVGSVAHVAAPAGSYPVRILATTRPRGKRHAAAPPRATTESAGPDYWWQSIDCSAGTSGPAG